MPRGPDPRTVIGLWPQSGDVDQQDEKLRVNAPHPPITLAKGMEKRGLIGCLELVREWQKIPAPKGLTGGRRPQNANR